MIRDINPHPTIAVADLNTAKKFYGEVLGLELIHENEHSAVFQCGDSRLEIYISEYAGSNKATYVTWEVENIDGEVAELRNKGVTFEHYDMEGTQLEGDVHIMGNEKAVWFTDPTGNILCLHSIR